MDKLKYSHLITPITLAGVTFRNCIFASPTGYTNTIGDSVIPPEGAAYYERKAIGGADQTCIDDPRTFKPLCRVANGIGRF